MDTRQRIVHGAGLLGLTAILVGATLYAVGSPHRSVTMVFLTAGALLLAAYIGINFRVIREITSRRSSRYGANMLVMIVLFCTIVVIVQALSVRHSYRYDLTRNKRFSLADQTLSLLGSLRGDIEIFAFFTTMQMRITIWLNFTVSRKYLQFLYIKMKT